MLVEQFVWGKLLLASPNVVHYFVVGVMFCPHPGTMPVICLIGVVAVLCSTGATTSQEQLYDINVLGSGFVLMFLVPMCKAAALCL